MTVALVHFNHHEGLNLTGWPDMRTSSWKPNYGDMLVCAAILRQVKLSDDVRRVGFGDTFSTPIERALIRGSTYLHGGFDFAAANKTLDSINAPTAIVGLGAQNPVKDVTFLDGNAGARDFVARLNEKSVSISARGAFTAAVIDRLGGKSIRITGCPSLFYSLGCPKVSVPEMLRRPERSLGISIHTGLTKNIFCNSPQQAKLMHGLVFGFALRNASNVSIFEQGVLREYDVADRTLDFQTRLSKAEMIQAELGGEGLFTPYDLLARMVSVKNIEEWIAKARDLDAIIGFRFHGNMVALMQGRPCFYYIYDSRLAEFADLYGLPWQDVNDEFSNPVDRMLEHDWSGVNANIATCFKELKTFYNENGFEHRFEDVGD